MDEHTAFEQAYKNGYEQGLMGLPNFGEVVYRKNMEKLENSIYQEIVKVGITVDKDKIAKALTDARAFYKEGYEKGLKDAVKHGRWIHAKTYYEIDECNCSLCGQLMTTEIDKRMNYCPNCGARMDLEE